MYAIPQWEKAIENPSQAKASSNYRYIGLYTQMNLVIIWNKKKWLASSQSQTWTKHAKLETKPRGCFSHVAYIFKEYQDPFRTQKNLPNMYPLALSFSLQRHCEDFNHLFLHSYFSYLWWCSTLSSLRMQCYFHMQCNCTTD